MRVAPADDESDSPAVVGAWPRCSYIAIKAARGNRAPRRQTIIVAGGRIVKFRAFLTTRPLTPPSKLQNSPIAHGLPSARHAICPMHAAAPHQRRAPALHKVGYLIDSATRTAISSPTRLQALMFEAARRPAARLKAGLRPSSCA